MIPEPVDDEAAAEEAEAEADTAPAVGVVLFPVASPTMAPTPVGSALTVGQGG